MIVRGLFSAFLIFAAATPALAQEKQPPYWASVASGEAMTHTGPGRNYPNVWLYQRRDLPVADRTVVDAFRRLSSTD